MQNAFFFEDYYCLITADVCTLNFVPDIIFVYWINHFINSSWGPVIPEGEAFAGVEGAKGHNGYYVISNGNTTSYRTRIRAPSFPHMQMLPYISRGYTVADLLSILGSIDYVLADVDR